MRSGRVHPTAVIESGACLEPEVEVGPYAVIGGGVHLGAETRIGAHCVIQGETRIGPRCSIGPHVVLGTPAQLRGPDVAAGRLLIGPDNRLREFATVHCGSPGSETVLGRGNLLMAYAHVAHDCRLGDGNELANAVQVAGHVVMGDRITVGGLAGIHQHVRVGDLALLAAGAMVSQDVLPYCCVSGDRARVRGINRVGLKRAGIEPEVRTLLARAVRRLLSAATLAEGVDAVRAEGGEHVFVARLVAFALSSNRGLCRPAV